MDIKQRVIDKFNEVFGAELKNLDKIGEFHEKLEAEKREIEQSVSVYILFTFIDKLMEQFESIVENYF